ncbi:alkaline phosphatase family protein [Dyadobacter frigoris]|uniref:Alkaline phosphatase family protein n=1 Tax=Dyadobacter frigoris TaxID=2576211 RepID=A0A4U6CWQ0_9BACT|nr:alkaline phosphatase family protein [Dyadobacter frigoris]TKT87628.1 alkaline phosphatase family protein [Dyadobacter frigoris]GLU52689.1 hypothetical protein Dfri01_21500 [Dyadobacter frigoris]
MKNILAKVKLTGLAVIVFTVFLIPDLFAQIKDQPAKNKTLIVFFDGLRPDYITPEQMPNLFGFKEKASYGKAHHSVFPTVTRVNSASYATGSYPGTHGLLGNAVYFPQANKTRALGTTYEDLTKIEGAISGPLLTAVSLGEVLESAGERMMVFSSGTTGQAYLQNHKVGRGAVINPDLILPESSKSQVLAEIGTVALSGPEGNDRHRWITDALLKYGFDKQGPLVSAIWFSDPDGAAHKYGIGSTQAVSAIQYVDAQFGRILQEMKTKGISDHYNIIISTDHGFVTHTGQQNLVGFLIQEGFKKDKESDDMVIAEGAIYVKDHNADVVQKIVAALHKQPWVGAVFTRSKKRGEINGWVEGTFSFDAVHYNHERSGDILIAPNWNDNKNDKGYAGTDFSGGVAGHGGSSPYEVHIALMADGPDFKKGFQGELPTSNIDITPTVLGIYGLPVPVQMDGRVMQEFLKKTEKTSPKFKKQTLETQVKYPWGVYKLSLEMSVLDKYRYFDYSKTERIFN